jgi:hypothetical protein
MTEQEIINMGFEKVEVLNSESQNGYDYYYYIIDLMPGLSLHTSCDDESSDEWLVYNPDWDVKLPLEKEAILQLFQIAKVQGYLNQHHQ